MLHGNSGGDSILVRLYKDFAGQLQGYIWSWASHFNAHLKGTSKLAIWPCLMTPEGRLHMLDLSTGTTGTLSPTEGVLQ